MASDDLHTALDGAGASVAIHLASSAPVDARRVLAEVAEELGRLPRSPLSLRISPVVALLDGAIVRVDDLPADPAQRTRIATTCEDIVVEAGMALKAISARECTGLSELDETERAVILRLFPTPESSAGRIPEPWVELAADWVAGDLPARTVVRLRVLGVAVEVAPADLSHVLHSCAAARAWCDAVTGDSSARIRTASISFGIAPHLALAAGGPRVDDAGLSARFELLCDVAGECVEAAYACVDFEDTFIGLGTGLAQARWASEGGAPPNQVAGRLVDVRVPEAYPFQMLGPGHREHRGEIVEDSIVALVIDDLDDQQWTLRIGDPTDWLPGKPTRHRARSSAWEVLDTLLLHEDELVNVVRNIDATTPTSGMSNADVPEAVGVVIDADPHDRRGSRLTVLEYAAWLAGERHTDAPKSVSPVVQDYVRALGAGLDPDHRQGLAALASLLPGTGPGDATSEDRRCHVIADTLLRTHAPVWLGAAGQGAIADSLLALPAVTDERSLVRSIDLLGSSVTDVSVALEAVLDAAGDDMDDVESVAWDLWEEAAARTGMVAATDALAHGVPGELAFTADQRVMECSRDAEIRRTLVASRRGLSDEVFWVTLLAASGEAWNHSWEVAEEFVYHESTFSLRTTLRRTLEQQATDDPVDFEFLLDEVGDLASDTIARLILLGDRSADLWKRTMHAAVETESGRVWLHALRQMRDTLGGVLMDDALEAGREELATWADGTEVLVYRAVAAAISREACSISGRATIASTIVQAMNEGLDLGAAEARARGVVEHLVDQLADEAIRLVADVAAVR